MVSSWLPQPHRPCLLKYNGPTSFRMFRHVQPEILIVHVYTIPMVSLQNCVYYMTILNQFRSPSRMFPRKYVRINPKNLFPLSKRCNCCSFCSWYEEGLSLFLYQLHFAIFIQKNSIPRNQFRKIHVFALFNFVLGYLVHMVCQYHIVLINNGGVNPVFFVM